MYNDLKQKALNWLFRELQNRRIEQGTRETLGASEYELRELREQVKMIDLCIDSVLKSGSGYS